NLSNPHLHNKFFLTLRRLILRLTGASVVFGAALIAAIAQDVGLEGRLKSEAAAALAVAARGEGDAARGAIGFHQPHTTCTKCHAFDGSSSGLGPDLTSLPKETTDAQLVESLLEPSKTIRKGFELVTVAMSDGRTLTGLVVESNDQRIVLRDPAQSGQVIAIGRRDIERQSASGTSA